MAVVYFTSNASTGAGSLSEAVKKAQPGDVIRPDETVFERGSTIEIVLAATLTVDKNLTLDGGPFRVRLNGGGARRCAIVSANVTATFIGFDFVCGDAETSNGGGLNGAGTTDVTCVRCGFYGCAGTNGGGAYLAGVSALRDCVAVGCRATTTGGGLYLAKSSALNGVTVAGCVAPTSPGVRLIAGEYVAVNSVLCGVAGTATPTYRGCVVNVAASQIGFVASPPDDLAAETWNANLWQNWDLRLLDDASGAPSPYRDSGDVDAASKYDYQGNFRGRESEGVATCSPGAFETIQADLFWVGRDATGAEVVSPSFLTSNGWAASRFATVSGDVAPQNDDVVFIDGSIAFDGNSLRLKKLVVVGGASLSVDNSSGATLTTTSDQFDFGVGSTLRSVGSSTLRFQIGRSVLASRFGDWVNIQPQFLLGEAAGLEIAPTAKFTTVASSVKLYANGFYTNYNLQITNVATVEGDSSGCENVYVSFQKPTARIAANGTPRVACGLVKWTPPSDATSDFTALETGSAPIVFAPRRSATVAGNGSRDDFLIDVSNAQTSGTLALTLTGQTVCGDAPTSAVALTGSARIDARGLTSQTLTLNAGTTLNVDGGFACVETLTVADGATVAFSGVDAVLTATENATVGAASFSGTGYFATPQGTDLTAATFAETVRVSDFGAGVANFTATATGPTTATLAWSATDETARVCVERENAAAPNGWETLTIAPTAEASPLKVALSGRERFRIFDGQTFYVDSAWFPAGDFYVYVADSSVSALAGEWSEWTAITQTIKAGGAMGYRNENVMFMAQVKNRLSGGWLAPSDVVGITATVCRVYENGFAPDEWVPVDGWEGAEVPAECVLETPTPNDAWTADAEGPNFVWIPDVRERSFFPTGGKFATQLRFDLTGGRNPIYLTFVDEVD